jgi:hypothetical protein
MALLDMMYGCHGTMWYRWNSGYDGRFYYGLARVSAELAELEPFFLQSELKNAGNGVNVEGYPTESLLDINEGKWKPEFANAWMATSKDRWIVSLANLQERWAASVRWRVTGLPEGVYRMYDPLGHRYFTVNGSTKIPAAVLRTGCFLKLWPNDVQFRVIEPWTEATPYAQATELGRDPTSFTAAKASWNFQTIRERTAPPTTPPAR